jgi:Holliday junction resolvase RusA-like endonuclease
MVDRKSEDIKRVSLWIAGSPPRKSNQRTIYKNPKTRSPIIAKSQKARDWVDDALRQITGKHKLKLGSAELPVKVTCYVFYENRQPDLSIELVLDTLEKGEVLANDRHVYAFSAYKLFSKSEPGVYIDIVEATPWQLIRYVHFRAELHPVLQKKLEELNP